MGKSCECCRRYWNHISGKMKCFFSPMTPNFKNSMIIPKRFVNHFRGKFSGTVKLEAPNGNLYDVVVAEHMNETVLQSAGWEQFVSAHHIEENDLLMFQYRANSRFKVMIFDSSGCEKILSCVGIQNASDVRGSSADHVDISSSSHAHNTGSSESERFGRRQRGSSSHRRKAAKMDATASLSDESEEDTPSEHGSFESDDLQTSSEPGYVLSRRCFLSREQKARVDALIREIQPEIPVFVAVMKKSNINPQNSTLIIAKDYALAHFPRENQTITLELQGKNKKWHPRFYIRKSDDGHLLAGRWLAFVHDNRLREGDICIFQPLKERRSFTVTVYLLRKARKATVPVSNHGRTSSKITSAVHIKEEPADNENFPSSEHDRRGVAQEPSKPAYILPHKTNLTRAQRKKVEEKVKSIKCKFPIYVAIMNKCNWSANKNCNFEHCRNIMFTESVFGKDYATAYLPESKQNLTLHRMGKSKTWHTNMRVTNDGRWMILGGWREFAGDNYLRIGDIFLFELMEDEMEFAMTVHIIRKEQMSP